MKIKDYKLFETTNLEKLTEMVKVAASEGYVLQGGISVYFYNGSNSKVYTQTVVLFDKKSEPSDSTPDFTQEVIDYLNKRRGTRFQLSTSTKKQISARAKEGYKKEDFFLVIDNRIAKWGQDEKMSEYIRPETLFSNKFSSYLNNAAPQRRTFGV